MFTFLEDTTTGTHDTLYGCCDRFRYQQLGVGDYEHASCSENMHLALAEAAKAGIFPELVSVSKSVISKKIRGQIMGIASGRLI